LLATKRKEQNIMSDQLQLSFGYSNVSCKLHPVVVFSILDHFVMRSEGQTRVFGTLLGINNDGIIEIRNCFPVPHTEKDQVVWDGKDHRSMLELHLKANPQETVVGWYSTGASINDDSIRIHDFYWREMQAPPIHLLVDTGLTNDRLAINSYISTPLSFANSENALGFQFKPVSLEFTTQRPEKIGVDILLSSQQNSGVQDLDSLELSLKRLLSLLDIVSSYVDQVVKENEQADPTIGRMISDIVASLPRIDSPSFQKMFNRSIKDLLMVVWLTTLTQTQLQISDKFLALKL